MSVAIDTMSLPATVPEIESPSPTSVRRLTSKDAAILFEYQVCVLLGTPHHSHLLANTQLDYHLPPPPILPSNTLSPHDPKHRPPNRNSTMQASNPVD
jgi:hypothetical protein